jgi:anti-anti-sigma factor
MSTTPPAPGSGSQPPQKPASTAPRPMGQNAAPRPKPKMQTVVQGDIAIVSILESRILDENNINEIGKALMDLVTKQYMIKMIIDMGEVKYLSSAVLRQLIALYKAIKTEKGDLKICRVNPEVREVFKITQLDKMIEIKDDLESAINAFKKKGGWGFLQR